MSSKSNNSSKKNTVKGRAGIISRKPRETEAEKLAKQEAAIKEANAVAAKDPVYQGKSKLQVKTGDIIMALLGSLISAYATVAIMVPDGLTYGGTIGIARMLQNYVNISLSAITYIFAAIILIVCWITLGFKEVKKIVLLSLAYPVFMTIFEMLDVKFLESHDVFLAAVFLGVTFGISNGLTFKAGFSSGGTDTIAKIIKIKKLPHVGINDITFVINTAIVIVSALVFDVNVALYAIVTMYIAMRVGEAVMFGVGDKIVELNIITERPDSVGEYVMNELGRGVTSSEITGEYTGEKHKMLKVICSPRESFLIKRYLAEHDPQAFVSIFRVNTVWGVGRGFSDIRNMDN